jgi:tripartite-type tricarboxylate transporter receptor subunit TctC
MATRNVKVDDPLDDFAARDMTLDGVTKKVYVAGPAVIVTPAVIVMAENQPACRSLRALGASAPALTDLLAGQVQVMFDTTPASIEYIRAGRLRALAVTSEMRSEALPDIPTVSEFVPGYEASALFGLGVPANTPAEIIDRLNKEVIAGLADPGMKSRLTDLGGIMLRGSPTDFGKLIAEETEKWAKVVKFSGAKPD